MNTDFFDDVKYGLDIKDIDRFDQNN